MIKAGNRNLVSQSCTIYKMVTIERATLQMHEMVAGSHFVAKNFNNVSTVNVRVCYEGILINTNYEA